MMAFSIKYILTVIVFALSIAIWGTRGIFLMLLRIAKDPKSLFRKAKTDHSKIPACATDPSLGVHDSVVLTKTTSSSETSIKVKYVAKGEKGQPLMLCIHGFPECWYSWRYQLKEFSSKYWVVAIDLPGYGDSDKPSDTAHYTVDALANTVADIITHLGYETATVVAHDWGGAITWHFAAAHADMCDKVVIMNAPNISSLKNGLTFKQYCMSWYMFFFQLPWLPEMFLSICDYGFIEDCFRGQWGVKNRSNVTEEDVNVYKYALHSWDARNRAIGYYRKNNLLTRVTALKDGKRPVITAPVLLIWGTEDVALSLELAVKSAKISDLVTVEFVDDASHWVQQDNPKEVNRLMWNFLK